jgi:hypothetical protein
MASGRFGTVINCMDGRVQDPVSRWLKERYQLTHVDVITEPGPGKILAGGPSETVEAIKKKVRISLEAHRSNVIAIAAHHDCAGNPVNPAKQFEEINQAVGVIRRWGHAATIVGLWVNEKWEVEVVSG